MIGGSQTAKRFSSNRLTVVLVLVSAILAGATFRSWRSAIQRVEAADSDLSHSRQIAADIERLRVQPRVAAIDQETSSAITRRVSQSMQASSVPQDALIRVEPQTPIRINRTQYMSRSTRIELADVSLEQVIQFAHSLGDREQGLVVQSLLLSEPLSESGSAEVWLAEITLTQTIFSPTIR
jgi:Tfp pilus assembly protein PilE